MDYKEYFKGLEQDNEYIKAEQELKYRWDIADEILRLRIERGWSQSELARRVGTQQANISRLENGSTNPTIKFLEKLANAFRTQLVIYFDKTPYSVINSTIQAEDVNTSATPIPVDLINSHANNSGYTAT